MEHHSKSDIINQTAQKSTVITTPHLILDSSDTDSSSYQSSPPMHVLTVDSNPESPFGRSQNTGKETIYSPELRSPARSISSLSDHITLTHVSPLLEEMTLDSNSYRPQKDAPVKIPAPERLPEVEHVDVVKSSVQEEKKVTKIDLDGGGGGGNLEVRSGGGDVGNQKVEVKSGGVGWDGKVEAKREVGGGGKLDAKSGGVGGKGGRFRPGLSILRKGKREKMVKRVALGIRIFGAICCLISFSVMAADKNKGWALDSFDLYKEFRYSLSVNVIGFVYSAGQAFDTGFYLATGKSALQHPYRYYFDFTVDQIITYLLISASSSASTRIDDWQLNWGKDKFPNMATASVAISFLAFVAIAFSSLISGYTLCTSKSLQF